MIRRQRQAGTCRRVTDSCLLNLLTIMKPSCSGEKLRYCACSSGLYIQLRAWLFVSISRYPGALFSCAVPRIAGCSITRSDHATLAWRPARPRFFSHLRAPDPRRRRCCNGLRRSRSHPCSGHGHYFYPRGLKAGVEAVAGGVGVVAIVFAAFGGRVDLIAAVVVVMRVTIHVARRRHLRVSGWRFPSPRFVLHCCQLKPRNDAAATGGRRGHRVSNAVTTPAGFVVGLALAVRGWSRSLVSWTKHGRKVGLR